MHDIDSIQLEDPGIYRRPAPGGTGGFVPSDDEFEFEGEGVLGEQGEIELAERFLEIDGEQDLEFFLGDLLRGVTGAAGNLARSREGRQIGGILKQAAGRVLPVAQAGTAGHAAGGALADATGGSPGYRAGVGSRQGKAVTAAAKRYFDMELEGLSHEDQEFEVARRFVRFGAEAIRNLLDAMGTGPAQQTARRAVVDAARAHAPGLVTESVLNAARSRRGPGAGQVPPARPAASGRWQRRGDAIVLYPN